MGCACGVAAGNQIHTGRHMGMYRYVCVYVCESRQGSDPWGAHAALLQVTCRDADSAVHVLVCIICTCVCVCMSLVFKAAAS